VGVSPFSARPNGHMSGDFLTASGAGMSGHFPHGSLGKSLQIEFANSALSISFGLVNLSEKSCNFSDIML